MRLGLKFVEGLLFLLIATVGAHAGIDIRQATFDGRVQLPPTVSAARRAEANVLLTAPDGLKHRAYCLADGTFSFHGLPAGIYLLDVIVIGFMFPEFRVDVIPGSPDPVRVSVLSSRAALRSPATLRPLGEAKYYQSRKPINIRGLLLSPYGLMAIVAIFAIFISPSLKVDPEEMKQMKDEMKDSPLSFLFGGAPAGNTPITPAVGGTAVTDSGGSTGTGPVARQTPRIGTSSGQSNRKRR